MSAEEPKIIALVIYQKLAAIDLIGPLQVLSALSQINPQFQPIVVSERLETIVGDDGIQLIPNKTFDEVPHPYAILVPGGGESTLQAMSNEAPRKYVRSAAETAEIAGSVCTGSLILGSVGLLEGRQASTFWPFHRILEALGAHYRRDRWVEDGKFITSAGVMAGVDMALFLVAKLTDEATARRVQLEIQYDPQPPFGGMDWHHLPLFARFFRAIYGLRAPFIAAHARRLTRQGV